MSHQRSTLTDFGRCCLSFVVSVALGGMLPAGCSSSGGSQNKTTGSDTSTADSGSSTTEDTEASTEPVLTIEPQDEELVLDPTAPVPTIQYVAKLDGETVAAKWDMASNDIGVISSNGLFTPSATSAGKTTVRAIVGSHQASTSVGVVLQWSQNGLVGENEPPGSGGYGGVGGEGLGPAVSQEVKAVLDGTAIAANDFTIIYPYDETVWPLGLLAPLLQWSALPAGTGDGVLIKLTGPLFTYQGYFGRPTALANGAPFVRHSLPQSVWKAATRSAAGATLTVEVTIASAGQAYGPLSQTWTIARGSLRGTVYYQSYGTNLAKNYPGAKPDGRLFGGATLSIKGNSTGPTLVAGSDGGTAQCRVCHSVSSNGGRMLVQRGENYRATSGYDLQNGNVSTDYPAASNERLGWGAITPDGKMVLGHAAPYVRNNANSTSFPTNRSGLFDLENCNATTCPELSTAGWSDTVLQAGFPMFSPDGSHLAFNYYEGPAGSVLGAGVDGTRLAMMDFDASTRTFSNPLVLYTGSTDHPPGWPAFWPTNNAVVFQVGDRNAVTGEWMASRSGSHGELWWADLATQDAAPLNRLNGKIGDQLYLPTGANNHGDDSTYNYEPTISPIASGGYAWIVFMSRRLYGNVATIDPWWSDPREHDLTVTPTTKKLWIAALDLTPKAGQDPSHPAFYLPAQELLAGNTRGFWVADPCKADGEGCDGGDECCSGYCTQVSPDSSDKTCGPKISECAEELDKCTVDADCCDFPQASCVNGYCAGAVVL